MDSAMPFDEKDGLRSWYQDYMAADANNLGQDSELIQAVEADELSQFDIERQIRQRSSAIDVKNGFCRQCRHLLGHWPNLSSCDWATKVGRQCSIFDIEAAALQNCKFCKFLLSRLTLSGRLRTFRQIEARLRLIGDESSASLSVQRWAREMQPLGEGGGAQLLWLNLPGKVATDCNSSGARVFKFESDISWPTKSLWRQDLNVFELAKTWLRDCCASHRTCQSIKEYGRPTRLIELQEDGVKLVLTESWEVMPRYATLSYCWGHEEFTKLTSDTLEAFLNGGITLNSLPQTFRDAIHVTRRLGLRHLWIDALCIIQNEASHTDWEHEVTLMHSIYSACHVCVLVTSAKGAQEGFLNRSSSPNGVSARVTVAPLSPEDGAGYSTVRKFHEQNIYEEACTETHLAGRGWCLQEKLLSPRTLSFGMTGVFWECRTKIASEFIPDEINKALKLSLLRPEDSKWSWRQIVERSSATQLTVGTDRLPSLSGIAARQHDAEGGKDLYLAGMWRKNLARQLVWARCSRKTARPALWRAPSWSWASIDGLTRYWGYCDSHYLAATKHILILNAWTKLAGLDPFGAITEGKVVAACSALLQCRFFQQQQQEKHQQHPHGSEDGERDLVMLKGRKRPVPIVLDCTDDVSLDGNTDPYCENEDNYGRESLFLLPICSGRAGTATKVPPGVDLTTEHCYEERDGTKFVDWQTIKGIVLQRYKGTQGSFRRVGSFSSEYCDFPPKFTEVQSRYTRRQEDINLDYEELMAAMSNIGEITAHAEAAEVVSSPEELPGAKYVITIE